MCGIFGYIGKRNPAAICLKGLKHLEYRGYDSAGLAGINAGKLFFYKEVGKLAALEAALEKHTHSLDLAIAHTRWATHGKPTKENAHPHFDEAQSIAVVHNGIIENHATLRDMLLEHGRRFYSDTDTEIIAQLIAHFYEGDFLLAVQRALGLLKGFWGIAVIHKNHPDQIVAAARENPIAIGFNTARLEAFISSDANAFGEKDLDVMFLKNDEVAVICPETIRVFDQSSTLVQKNSERLQISSDEALSKNGYAHFMLKEIFEQPQTIQQAFHNRLIPDFGTADFEQLTFTSQDLLAVRRIVILACGTSWHAGLVAAQLLEDKARIPTQAEIASEFRYKNPIIAEDTLVIAISQSGETLDTIAAVREAKSKGAKILSVCNVRNSTLHREADCTLFLRAGPEVSVCSTKNFTSTLTVLSLFTLLMARLRHMSKEEGQDFIAQIQSIPASIEYVLQQKSEIHALAKKYAHYSSFFFLGRHYMHITCLEAALKLKEISYINAQGYPAGEMKHGPIALVDGNLAVVGLCGNMRTLDKMTSSLMEVKARGAPVLAFAPYSAKEIGRIADDVLWLPQSSDDFAATFTYTVVTQLLAYYIALERGTDIDQPRNLAKSVTVE